MLVRVRMRVRVHMRLRDVLSTLMCGLHSTANVSSSTPLAGIANFTSGFESDLDGWTTGAMDRSFTRQSFEVPKSFRNTGPSAAAVGTYYVFAYSFQNFNLNFDLEKTFPAGQEPYGIAFQYHMYGADMGSVVLESSADGTGWLNLWSRSGDQGNQWSQATVYAGSGQAMLRFTCVPFGRRAVIACDP